MIPASSPRCFRAVARTSSIHCVTQPSSACHTEPSGVVAAGGGATNSCSATKPENSACIPPSGSHTLMAPVVSPW